MEKYSIHKPAVLNATSFVMCALVSIGTGRLAAMVHGGGPKLNVEERGVVLKSKWPVVNIVLCL